jgi:nitrogen fixation NifU-like protein
VSSDLRDLYQEVVIDHSRKPRNFRKPEGANRRVAIRSRST